ncbi:MAG: hypothetical protein IJU66_00880 [Oscillospiraceae bacterium]|nr:hypothetical protein [Oscillospiraceae bacterium]
MKAFQRGLCLALAALLTLSLGIGARAAEGIGVSTWKLSVNGEIVPARAYSVNGENYFKLRDIACAMEGTKAKFDVVYDQEENVVRITTSRRYQRLGSELAEEAEDLSATASISSQTVYIDGKKAKLTAYNIGGANYFRLRDLGKALHFDVDFDPALHTVLVASEAWTPDIPFNTTDLNKNMLTDVCFCESKLTVVNLWAYWVDLDVIGQLLDLQKIATKYADKGVRVLGVCKPEDIKYNREMLNKFEITYTNLRYTSDFDTYMGTDVIPKTLLVDSSGRLLDIVTGSMSYDQWVKLVEKHLP